MWVVPPGWQVVIAECENKKKDIFKQVGNLMWHNGEIMLRKYLFHNVLANKCNDLFKRNTAVISKTIVHDVSSMSNIDVKFIQDEVLSVIMKSVSNYCE